MIANLRNRYTFFATVSVLFFLSATLYMHDSPITSAIQKHLHSPASENKKAVEHPEEKPHPKYKPEPDSSMRLPSIVDNFPLAAAAHSAADLPPIPTWNKPSEKHVDEITPLLIGFTRNWPLLQQVVVSYVTAGWPVEDIYVVENTGVMDSNAKGKLSLQNPFFMNHTRLDLFGVNIIRTPTLLTFAQLQNFYLHTAIENDWPAYFWSHMDVAALTNETIFQHANPTLTSATANHTEYRSLYQNAVLELRAIEKLTPPASSWSLRFFSYDHLTLVRTQALVEVGGWDTMIPYYSGDCDMHHRLSWAQQKIELAYAGDIYDVASTLDDLVVLYRKKNLGVKPSFTDPNILLDKMLAEEEKKKEKEGGNHVRNVEPLPEAKLLETKTWEDDDIGSPQFRDLADTLEAMKASKLASKKGRNTWQMAQLGGKGEPFYRDALGFEKALGMTVEVGRQVFAEKWGHRDCHLDDAGVTADMAWRVEHDWE